MGRNSRLIRLLRGLMWLACTGVSCATSFVGHAALPVIDAPAAIHPADWPTVPAAIGPDASLEAHISELLAGMTLEQKVGQLIQADIGSITPDDIRQFPLGSILNGGDSSPGNNEFAPPSEWLALADRFYEASMQPAHAAHPIPLLWGTDAVHGHNKLVGATIFPHNIGLGAARDPELVRLIGEATAREVRATGLDWTFGPALAVVRDTRWGRTYESYSEDPQIVREYAGQMVLGLQGVPGSRQFLDSVHIISTAKHFLGDGGTGGRDQGDNPASEPELRDIHLAGYPAALTAGVQAVMVSSSSWQGVKMQELRELLTEVLKERMHFDGIVIGDWNGHGHVPGCTNVSCAPAINAGVDVLMAPADWRALFANLRSQAQSGLIPASRLDAAVRRVLRVKLRARLFDEGRPSSRPLAGEFRLLGAPEHRLLARRAVRESLVLLKNEKHILPLSPRQRVLVAGDGADNIGRQSGGWTLTWQGSAGTNANFPHGESIYSGIRTTVAAGGGTTELSPTGIFVTRPDVAVVVFGESPYAEMQGDVATVEYSADDKSDLRLLRSLRAQGVPVVAVFLSGRPLWVNAEINASDAFVAAWLPGTEGGGIADVLFRAPDGSVAHDFRGKLSFAWPRTELDYSVDHRDGRSQLFAYGFGLRYGDDGATPKLGESRAARNVRPMDARELFVSGRPEPGWRWVVAEGTQTVELPRGVGQTSGGRLRLATAGRVTQEDARRIQWTGTGEASVRLVGNQEINLQRQANSGLSLGFDYRVDRAPAAQTEVRMECGSGCVVGVNIGEALKRAPPQRWDHLQIPLTCFARAGADLSRITTPFEISSSAPLELTVARIRIEPGTDTALPCPAIPAIPRPPRPRPDPNSTRIRP